MDVEVRRCAAADVAVLSAAEPAGADLAETFFARQEAGECVYLVAWRGSEPVGTGELTESDPRELRNLAVRPEFRGQGIGTLLIAAAEAHIGAETGAAIGADSTLSIGVAVDNPDARRLYERLGFEPTGILSTTTYDYVDATSVTRTATEISELLTKLVTRRSHLSG